MDRDVLVRKDSKNILII
jgi:hypothetical protein